MLQSQQTTSTLILTHLYRSPAYGMLQLGQLATFTCYVITLHASGLYFWYRIEFKMVSNRELNDKRVAACIAVLTDNKYFSINSKIFMKRTLRQYER